MEILNEYTTSSCRLDLDRAGTVYHTAEAHHRKMSVCGCRYLPPGLGVANVWCFNSMILLAIAILKYTVLAVTVVLAVVACATVMGE